MATRMLHKAGRRPDAGFTYLMLLWWVAIGGVLLMALSRSWTMEARREREAELVFRGEQIRRAIEAYASVPVAQDASRYPAALDALVADERGGRMVRHLRRIWPDPVTGGEWGLIRSEDGGIRGVHSQSVQVPLRAPAGVMRYDEWRFEAVPAGQPRDPGRMQSPSGENAASAPS